MSYYRTPEHRRLRAELIRQWKPWEQSTGPRTEAGKATSARNSRKHGNRSREEEADRIIAIGSDRMMVGVGKARHDVLKQFLKPHHFAIGSINSPMQCMMKEICAQCLQQHCDPKTGELTYVFSFFNQDQPLDSVNFHLLNERLKQNSLQEKLSMQWLGHCLHDLRRQRALV